MSAWICAWAGVMGWFTTMTLLDVGDQFGVDVAGSLLGRLGLVVVAAISGALVWIGFEVARQQEEHEAST